jgi:AcrR family transcriptional regulator
MARLLEAGLQVFADRGYHASRVDDIVRAAKASHGTFYLYFTNKEDLLRALAVDCAQELTVLADTIGPITPDAAGRTELRGF